MGLQLHDPSATLEELQRELARERQMRQSLERQLRERERHSGTHPVGSRVCNLM